MRYSVIELETNDVDIMHKSESGKELMDTENKEESPEIISIYTKRLKELQIIKGNITYLTPQIIDKI